MGIRALGAASSLLFLATAVPASADELPRLNAIDIAVHGTISQQCAMGSIGDMNFGNLERRGLIAETRVAFSCNMPFTMRIHGEKGGLAHTQMPAGQGPYAGTVPYSLSVDLPVRHPAVQHISRSFGSRQLQSGGTVSSNGGIATDGMLLKVELGNPASQVGLLAGEYSETITIIVSPS